MNINFYSGSVYQFDPQELIAALGKIHAAIDHMQGKIMSALTDLQAAISANTDATNAAVAKLGSLPAGTDEAAIAAVTSILMSNTEALTNAVAALSPAPAPAPADPGASTEPAL